MTLRELIIQLVQVAIFFAFPVIWELIVRYLPWWPLDPESTLNILIFVVVTGVSWLLGYLGIKRLVVQLQARGFAAKGNA
ncbi:MAG: hypothetical protein P8184_01805 [Calditrichia bacterium]